jgi:predicted small lipoprotein YifL
MKKILTPLFLVLLVLACSGCGKKPPDDQDTQDTSEQPESAPLADTSAQLDLMLSLEDELGLEEVLISQDNQNLLIRFKAPTITTAEIDNGMAQIFAFVDQRCTDDIKTIKLILTVNHVDSAIVEAQRQDIARWLDGSLSNQQFVDTFNIISLIE